MNISKYLYPIGLLIVLLSCRNTAFSQVTLTSSNNINCVVPTSTLTATMTGDAPTDAGVTVDDFYPGAALPIGFSFNFYGTPYTSCLIGPNGTLCFNTSLAGLYDDYIIPATPFLGNPTVYNSICGPWTDVDIVFGGTIMYSTDGVAPNRKFVVTYCATHMYSCTDEWLTTQIILYETSNEIEVHLGHRTICASGWNGSRAIIGVQNATGTAATVAPGRDVSPTWTAINEGWRFIPASGGGSYTVGSIPYAPIPYASSVIYWYDITAGTYLGSTPTTPISTTTGVATLTVSPTVTTTYKAAALGCADTSFAFVTVTVAASLIVTSTFTNPTLCGNCDGTITLSGMIPGRIDTINYTKDGIPQPTVIATVSATGTVTLTGLCAGVYTGIIVKQGACSSAPLTVTLTNPGISISGVTPTDASYCGLCDGKLVLHGLYPAHAFTVTYTFNSAAQPPVSVVSNATGDITLTGLCEGVYDNIVAYFAVCTTAAVGPYTIGSPPLPPGRVVASVSPTECGFCNGSITLKGVPPFSSDTVTFDRDGVPQPAIVTAALGDSSVYLTGLCKGTYSNFSIKIGKCVYLIIGGATLVDPKIVPSFSSIVNLGCKGDSVLFTNHSTSSGPLYYIWKFGDGSTDTSKNPLHIYAQGSYTVTMYVTNHACIDSADTSYVFDHPLNAAFTATPMIVCQGSPVAFTNASVGNGATYLWNFGTGATSTATDPTYTFANSGLYNVQLIVTDTIPCQDTAYVQVAVDTISGVRIGLSDSVLCAGTYVTMTAFFASVGNTGVTWNLDNGDSVLNVNPLVHAFNTAKTFTVSVTPHYRACQDATTSRVVTVMPQPTISLGSDTSICAGSEMITLKDEVNGAHTGASWKWSNGSKGPSTIIVAPGIYFATVNINNCYASDTVVVNPDCYMNIPNVFTPNGDGVNDYFYPRSLLTKGLTGFKMDIYNRWGQLIFETTSLDGAGWDGKLNGVQQPQGVFVYVIDATFRDGQKEHHQGNVTLMR